VGWGGDQMRFWRGEERMLRMKRWGEMEGRAKIKTFRKVGARVCSFCLCIFSSLHLLVSHLSILISHLSFLYLSLNTKSPLPPFHTPPLTNQCEYTFRKHEYPTAKASEFEIIKTRLSGSVGRQRFCILGTSIESPKLRFLAS